MLEKLLSNPRRLFLIDAMGALVTCSVQVLFLLLPAKYFEIPEGILKSLISVAFAFFIYSISCYFFAGDKWKLLLRVIATLNIIYCGYTVGIIFYFAEQLTILAKWYFWSEVLIILTMAFVELKATVFKSHHAA